MPSTSQTIPLERKKIVKKTLQTIFRLFLPLAFLGGFMFFSLFLEGEGLAPELSSLANWVVLAVIVLLVIITFAIYFYQRAYFRSYFYDITDDALVIKKGVFTPRESTLPYKKINDVYVDMDLLDRLFGLRDVHVATASDLSAFIAHVDGVSAENAEKLRDLILQRIKKS